MALKRKMIKNECGYWCNCSGMSATIERFITLRHLPVFGRCASRGSWPPVQAPGGPRHRRAPPPRALRSPPGGVPDPSVDPGPTPSGALGGNAKLRGKGALGGLSAEGAPGRAADDLVGSMPNGHGAGLERHGLKGPRFEGRRRGVGKRAMSSKTSAGAASRARWIASSRGGAGRGPRARRRGKPVRRAARQAG